MAVRKNKESWAKYMREYRKKNPEIMRKIDLKKNYGLSWDQYTQLLLKQNSVCAICHKPETKLDWQTNRQLPLSVDHCHTSGKVRGLLCADCNRALGMFQDSPEILSNAVLYVSRTGA